ncbi:MAG: hypothetical protein IKV32_06100 [Muribaculaceae bacterium]|nr:hypothetical protein [Muribaculaceae bacterium]
MTAFNRIIFLVITFCIGANNTIWAGDKYDFCLSAADSMYLNLVEMADYAIASEDWVTAEEALLSAMRGQPANPANVLLLSNLSIVRYQQGKDSLALATINDALIMAPRSITALNHRARMLKNMGLINDAYRDYQTILEIDSSLVEPRYMHGIIALSNHDYATAHRDFTKLSTIAPDNGYTIDGMAMYYYYTGEFDKAIPYFAKLLNNNPSIENYSSLILCHLFLEQLSEASTTIADAMKLYPLEGHFYLHRAYLNHLYYRHNDSDNDIKRAIELGIPTDEANHWRDIIRDSMKIK